MKETRVGSWNELNEQLYEGSWQEDLGRFRSPYAFRGMADAAYDMMTSLMRLGNGYKELENSILRTFKRYARRYIDVDDDSMWNWLALAQHHGLPTRLLDFTFSPYVAMHFATENLEKYNEDAVIWCVNYEESTDYLPEKLSRILREEEAHVFTVEMLQQGAATFEELTNLADRAFIVFLEPPSLDERIVNQFALFALISDATLGLEEWLSEHPALYRKIIIPAELKWEVRDKLDQANITERVLYPGLDGLSQWLKRYYTPARGKGLHRENSTDSTR
ncbi:MAG: FRG domain-containing protein [Chloroflexota bacterium]|nr:FRG domain-containing protein [Chloroflexota bacterium]